MQTEDNFHRRLALIGVSILCHAVLIVVLVFVPNLSSHKKYSPPVINVDLVSLAASSPIAESLKNVDSRAEKKTVAKAETSPAVTPQRPAAVPLKTKADAARKPAKIKKIEAPADKVQQMTKSNKVKQSLKKKTYQASSVRKNATPPIEKKQEASTVAKAAEASSPSGVSEDVFQRLKEKVAKEAAGRTVAGAESIGAGGIGTGVRSITERTYLVQVADEIQQNWAFSRQLAGSDANLMTALIFKVMPNGEIRDIIFEKRSGNSYLDDSAYRAIIKANPVRPHPPGIKDPFVIVGLRFTPSGIE